jgi:hypothetical protein
VAVSRPRLGRGLFAGLDGGGSDSGSPADLWILALGGQGRRVLHRFLRRHRFALGEESASEDIPSLGFVVAGFLFLKNVDGLPDRRFLFDRRTRFLQRQVEGWRRPSRQDVLDLGCTRRDFCADGRSESEHVVQPARDQWIAHLPEDHSLAQQHTSLLQPTNSITWTSAHSRQLAVSNGLRILLVHGYDSVHHIKDDDLKVLSVRWSKGDGRSMLRSARSACFLGRRSEAPPATAGDSG